MFTLVTPRATQAQLCHVDALCPLFVPQFPYLRGCTRMSSQIPLSSRGQEPELSAFLGPGARVTFGFSGVRQTLVMYERLAAGATYLWVLVVP